MKINKERKLSKESFFLFYIKTIEKMIVFVKLLDVFLNILSIITNLKSHKKYHKKSKYELTLTIQ